MNRLVCCALFAVPTLLLAQSNTAHLDSAKFKYELKDYAGAIADYTKVIEINPKFARAYNNRAVCHARLGSKTAALSDLKQSVAIDQKFGHYGYARFHAMTGEAKKAIASLRRAFEAGFNDFERIDEQVDLDNIRALPEFKALIEEFKAKRGK